MRLTLHFICCLLLIQSSYSQSDTAYWIYFGPEVLERKIQPLIANLGDMEVANNNLGIWTYGARLDIPLNKIPSEKKIKTILSLAYQYGKKKEVESIEASGIRNHSNMLLNHSYSRLSFNYRASQRIGLSASLSYHNELIKFHEQKQQLNSFGYGGGFSYYLKRNYNDQEFYLPICMHIYYLRNSELVIGFQFPIPIRIK